MKGVKGILLMGGIGERFNNATTPKQFQLLGGKPLYTFALEVFVSSQLFEEVLLVTHPDFCSKIIGKENVRVVPGGPTRQASSLAGLLAAGGETDFVVIHDAVRPFVSQRILRENVETAIKKKAVDTCIPATDTIVYAKDPEKITSIPLRKTMMQGQTPQSFAYSLILKAHEQTDKKNASDD